MLRAALLAVLLAFTFSSAHAADVAPTIASFSPSATVTEGTALTLTLSVTGTTPFTYQWRKEGVPISGATSNKLTLDPIRVGDSGSYTVAVTNVAGSVTGGPILIAVTPATPPSFYHANGTVAVTLGNSFSMYA